MGIAGKSVGAVCALFAGVMMFLAPAIVTGDLGGAGGLPVNSARAEPDAEPLEHSSAMEQLDAAAKREFSSRFDDVVTGSLPRDAAAAEAAAPMTTRLRGIEKTTGFPPVMMRDSNGGKAAATGPETVGAIPPREVDAAAKKQPAPASEVTASLAGRTAGKTAGQTAGKSKSRAAAPRKRAYSRTYRRPARQIRPASPDFQDRGPVAKAFRIFVKGIGFIPSQL